MSVLWVAEAGSTLPPPQARQLVFQFDDQPAADGLVVPAATRPLQTGFEQHVLNRALANALLESRPTAEVVCGLYGCTLDLLRVSRTIGRMNALFTRGQLLIHRWRWEHATLHRPKSRSIRSSPIDMAFPASAVSAPFQAGGQSVLYRVPPGNGIRG